MFSIDASYHSVITFI